MDEKVYDKGTHVFEVTFDNGGLRKFYLRAEDIVDAARKILLQDWNQDYNFAVKIRMVEADGAECSY